MSESNSDHSANPNPGEPVGPASALPHVESPSMAPDDRDGSPEETLEVRNLDPGAREVGTAADGHARHRPDVDGGRYGGGRGGTWARTGRARGQIAALQVHSGGRDRRRGAARRRHRIRRDGRPAHLNLNATPAAMPADPATFTAALGRIDRELANLKSSIDGSAKQANSQIAKIADRMDRAEKSQAEAGAKLARTTESLDRLDHRLAANGAAGAAGEITGSTPSGTLAQGPGDRQAALADPRRAGAPAPTAILDGWVLRDVFNGGAMIQSPRNEILEVFPGDTLPGLGRIEGIKRQDGRWVVVTSRGLIVSR